MKYCAFLRGINLGQNRRVKMDVLAKIFEGMGFNSVKTVIASGNVVFEAKDQKSKTKNEEQEIEKRLVEKIEKGLDKDLGFQVSIFLRSIPELQDIVSAKPFKNLQEDENTKLYVAFVNKRVEIPETLK